MGSSMKSISPIKLAEMEGRKMNGSAPKDSSLPTRIGSKPDSPKFSSPKP